MDLDRLDALNRYWIANPPTDVLLASFLGVKTEGGGRAQPKNKKQSLEDFMRLASEIGINVIDTTTKKEP